MPACRAAIALLLLIGSAGCTKMTVPDELRDVQPMEVSGRQGLRINRTVRFGGFATAELRERARTGRGHEDETSSSSTELQRYSFTLTEADSAAVAVYCEATVERADVNFQLFELEVRSRGDLLCDLEPKWPFVHRWRLVLDRDRDAPLSGVLEDGDRRYEVEGTSASGRGTLWGATTGYRLRRDGRSVAAVEVVNRGRVWLAPDVAPRDRHLLAAAAAALLLFDHPDGADGP